MKMNVDINKEMASKESKGISRRNFLKATFAGFVLVSGGVVWKAVDQGVFSTGKGAAYEIWKDWNAENAELPQPLPLIKAAIMAANAHNAQPWLFRIQGEVIDLYADLSRNLGAMDPMLREMYISLGCALENLTIAAYANGYVPDVVCYPGSFDHIHVARIRLSAAVREASDLYHAIPLRHTDRSAYDTARKLPDSLQASLRQLKEEGNVVDLAWFEEATARKRMGELIVNATKAIVADADQSRDSHRWYRHDWDDIQSKKDGTTLDATGNSFLTRAFGKLIPVSEGTSNDYWLKSTMNIQVPTAAAFACLLVEERDRISLLQAGRLYQRMHLWATTKGLALQPLNQPNERADHEIHAGLEPEFGGGMRELINRPNGTCVFTFRIGYPLQQPMASPRRPAEEVVWHGFSGS